MVQDSCSRFNAGRASNVSTSAFSASSSKAPSTSSSNPLGSVSLGRLRITLSTREGQTCLGVTCVDIRFFICCLATISTDVQLVSTSRQISFRNSLSLLVSVCRLNGRPSKGIGGAPALRYSSNANTCMSRLCIMFLTCWLACAA
eukprot:Protomagalhaensia_sp_Gyna_25__3367@NODE_303_length_3982_cov_30_734973_g234_i0_p3_GENE_NODE_303_length_3982_cov_30_734973_g234_i0NODE_303_length_3982_cov_30_734973_g234_i0_p3_ORF_typecomplete_len145_score10_98X/PF00739_19/0_061X/PF00739_19/1_6e03_NODE_303_length_3982_cov_30_734973_g234_i0200634